MRPGSLCVGRMMSFWRTWTVALLALSSACTNAEEPTSKVRDADSSPPGCTSPANPSTTVELYCIGGTLFGFPNSVQLAARPVVFDDRVDGAVRRTQTGSVTEGDEVNFTLRRVTERYAVNEPRFNSLRIRARSGGKRSVGAEDWSKPDLDRTPVMSCDPSLFGQLDTTPLERCFSEFVTPAVKVQYTWNGRAVDPQTWLALDAEVRAFVAGMIVNQDL